MCFSEAILNIVFVLACPSNYAFTLDSPSMCVPLNGTVNIIVIKSPSYTPNIGKMGGSIAQWLVNLLLNQMVHSLNPMSDLLVACWDWSGTS